MHVSIHAAELLLRLEHSCRAPALSAQLPGGEAADLQVRDRAGHPLPGCRAIEGAHGPKRRFAAIEVIAGNALPVQAACRVLGVSESGFHAWRSRAPSPRSIRHAWLTDIIRHVHIDSRGSYGTRRVHAELTLGHGISVGHNAVEMLMRRARVQDICGRPRFRRVPNVATAADLVERQFQREDSDRLWVTDITEHPTREGKVYCCVVLDVFSRRVVGWSIDSSPTAALVTDALGMAINQRSPIEATVIHSDQSTQPKFTSWAFTRRAIDSGLLPSMGSVGDCFDNAVIESFGSAPGSVDS